jgi:cytochrome b subunit of formate dehydrogenase
MTSQMIHSISFRFFPTAVLLLFLSTITQNLRSQSVEDCLACHEDQSLTMEKKGKAVSIFVDRTKFRNTPHQKLVCTACHVGFDPSNIPHKETIEPVACSSCHQNAVSKHKAHRPMLREKSASDFPAACKQCHGTHGIARINKTTAAEGVAGGCATCHEKAAKTFANSAHATAIAGGILGAPTCIRCHENPITRLSAGKDSVHLKQAQEKVCLSCHLDDPNVRSRTAPSAGFIAAYDKSVHGAGLLKGNAKVANCVDCHGAHAMNKGSDASSMVNKANLATTCGKCHAEVSEHYRGSVHGVALKNGVNSAPGCTDCHGEHNILKHTDPSSPVAKANVSAQVCTPCHGSVKLTQKFGLATNRFQSFADSYHGLAGQAGSIEVANCASCHGVHDIKPSSDPSSRIAKGNLVKMCGTCHPGANENFTKGAVHIVATAKQEEVLYYVSTAYIILIIGTIGGMFLHNLLDFVKKSKRQLMYRRGLIERHHPGHRLYLRMSLSERIQHGSLVISFITLVVTGFALRFPDAWWVAGLREISPVMFEIRGILHRIAAVVMVMASLYHVYYVLFVSRGKELIRDLLPTWKDITDAIGVLKYNLGISDVKPKFERFSYIEKSEYWALVWGTIVMAATGVILWFDNTFLGLLTKLWWDVARTVHYYEAWLATLAIIVWHFYFVIFNPDIYPLNLAFWKGTLTEEEMEEEHPLELEAIKHRELRLESVEEDGPK